MIYLIGIHAIGALIWFCVLYSYRHYIVSPRRRLYGWASIVLMSMGWEVLTVAALWDMRPRRSSE